VLAGPGQTLGNGLLQLAALFRSPERKGPILQSLPEATGISMFLLLTVSEIYGKTGAADASNFQTLGSMLIAAGHWIQNINGIVFSVGTLMIFALFYQTRLIPRWLSGWGFIGAVLYFIAKIVSMFSPLHLAPDIGVGIGLLLVPTAIQEMVFAVWMIVKGFNRQKIAALSAKTD
jgi:hypothetical protein